MAIKLLAITKSIILCEKRKLDKYNTFVQNKVLFTENMFQEIRCKYMFSLKNNAIPIRDNLSSFWEQIVT